MLSMFPFCRLILLSWFLLIGQRCFAQQIRNLYFNSTKNIVRLDFSANPPQAHYTGISSGTIIGEGIAHAEDPDGNLIIWVNASGVYDKNGTLMPGSTGIRANPSSTEIVICPVPQKPKQFYIIYNNELCSSLYYSVVDLSLRGGLGDVSRLNVSLDPGNSYAEGLEIVKIPCSNNYWLLTYQCYTGFKRFLISSSGINAGTLMHPFDTKEHLGRGELDYHNGKMGYAVTYRNRAFVADFDPVSGSISNPKDLSFAATNGVYGLEFSPDASKVYFTDWSNRDFFGNISSPNLFRYDFTTGGIASWTIPYNTTNCSQAEVEGLGQIELARDGKLYIPHVGGCQITVVENANTTSPAFQLINVNTILSTGVSDHIQSEVSQRPLLTIADKYGICVGESVKLTGSGGNGSYKWQPAAGLSHPSDSITEVSPTVTTTYTLYATNQYNCPDTSSVTIVVKSPQQPVIEVVGNNVRCGNTEATLRARGLTGYVWTMDGITMTQASADSLLITKPGIYQVNGLSNGCPISSEPITVEPAFFVTLEELFVPNVFTPDRDPQNANETFVIKNYTGKLKLIIFNRWGKEVYQSNDYQNDWAAEGMPAGVYYFHLSHDNDCFKPQKGWVHVLR
jgi:hypothetical protein